MLKLSQSAISTAGFFLLSHPAVYEVVLNIMGTDSKDKFYVLGECTGTSHFIRTIIFIILIFTVMILINMISKDAKQTLFYYVKLMFRSGILFYIMSNPGMYELTGNMTGLNTYDECPTMLGLLLHTLAFFVIYFIFV